MAEGCVLVLRSGMILFNLLFWLGGCGVLGVGVWLSVTQGSFTTLSSTLPSLSAANLLITVGAIVIVISCFGCVGAVKESRPLLLAFFILLLLILLLEIIFIMLFFIFQRQIGDHAQDDLRKGLALFGTEGNIGLTHAWTIVQMDFRCCGVTNHTDWFEVFNATRVPDSCCLEYSATCGRDNPGTWRTARFLPNGISRLCWPGLEPEVTGSRKSCKILQTSLRTLYTTVTMLTPRPCFERVKDWLNNNLVALWIFAFCTALTQILGLVFSMTLFCQSTKIHTFNA